MPESLQIKEGLTLYRLNLQEQRHLSPVKEKRFLEKKSLKNLIYQVFGTQTEINHNQYGKPLLIGHKGNISVSHNAHWLLVLYSEFYEVGVDVEEIQERMVRLQDKFLSRDEISDIRNNPKFLTVAWCAKEAVLKCIGYKKVSFRNHLKIISFHPDQYRLTLESSWPDYKGIFDVCWLEEGQDIIAYAKKQNP